MSIKTEDFPTFTDLSRQIIADDESELYNQLLGEINKRLDTKTAALEAGLPSAEKTIAEAEHAALEASKRIVDLFWHITHLQKPTS